MFTQKHNVYEIHNFIVFSTLKEGGYFTYAKSPILIVTGKILPKAKEASPTCTLRVPVNESGTSLSPTPSGSPTSSVGSSNEGHDDMGLDPECYVEKVAPLPKAEGPFRPLLKIEDFKAVAMAGKTICSEPQKLLDKYMWKLIVKFSDDCCMSLFAEVMCVDEVWELKTEVAFYVINESQTYDSLDFRKYI